MSFSLQTHPSPESGFGAVVLEPLGPQKGTALLFALPVDPSEHS